MSYRLKNLAAGNFLLIFESEHSQQMSETLCVVETVTALEGKDAEAVYSLLGIKKSPYSLEWTSRTVSDSQDLKFTPMSALDAALWLERQKAMEKWSNDLLSAKQALDKAELKLRNLQHYFLQPAAPALEAEHA